LCNHVYNPAQSCTIQYNPAQSCTILYNPVQSCTILYNPVQSSTILKTLLYSLTPSLGWPHTAHSCTQMKGVEQATYNRMTTTVCWMERSLAREMPASGSTSRKEVTLGGGRGGCGEEEVPVGMWLWMRQSSTVNYCMYTPAGPIRGEHRGDFIRPSLRGIAFPFAFPSDTILFVGGQNKSAKNTTNAIQFCHPPSAA
jgi:hypothetical protein